VGVAGGKGPQRFSLACLVFFLFRGVQRGYFSFQRKHCVMMKADEPLISARGLPWQNPISACRSRLNEFYKKGCQEKSFPLDRTPRRFLSRDPAHCL
jgi:hypothetical protein